MSKNKLIFGAIVVVATIFVINSGSKNPDGLLGKVAGLGK